MRFLPLLKNVPGLLSDTQDRGIYFLLIRIPQKIHLTIRGKEHTVSRGWCVYTGSAQKNLSARIQRHIRDEKKFHWHIDYLLAQSDVREARVLIGAVREDEEKYALKWISLADDVPVLGFGASDSHIKAHLVWFKKRSTVENAEIWKSARRFAGI